jgi:hypothetical protein
VPATRIQRAVVLIGRLMPVVVLFVVGCSRNRGPATHTFLNSEEGILKRFFEENGHQPAIKLPQHPISPPRPTRFERQAYSRELAQYPRALEEYYARAIDLLSKQSGAFAQLQAQMGSIGASGVDREAVGLVSDEEKLLGDIRLLFLESSELYARRRSTLIREGQANFFDDIVVPAAEGILGSPTQPEVGAVLGMFKGFSNVAGRNASERQSIAEQFTRFHEAENTSQRDFISFQTERSQIQASLSSRYPEEDWAFLMSPSRR